MVCYKFEPCPEKTGQEDGRRDGRTKGQHLGWGNIWFLISFVVFFHRHLLDRLPLPPSITVTSICPITICKLRTSSEEMMKRCVCELLSSYC